MLLPDTWARAATPYPLSYGHLVPRRIWAGGLAAATGVMPLDMPESVLVRFKGEMQPGVTLEISSMPSPTTLYSRVCSPLRKGQEEYLLGKNS
ncbi:MAG: hypothetical protein CM15mP84_08940 [Cellvibrionales bacterium]|nr:MAG: hypothetical protein CM15mP84_08940 [Cellvibrionales bacterium]